MTIPARPEPVDLRMAWVHMVLCGLSIIVLVALQVYMQGTDWLDRLAVSSSLGYAALMHAHLAQALRRGEPWAREGSAKVAIMLMMAAPFGTVIGALMLWTAWGRDRRLPRRKPQVPLIEAWPEADRLRTRAAEDRGAPETDP